MSHTLAEVYTYASQFIRLAPLTFTTPPTGGRTGDPALSIGDWVRQTILAPPFSWRWNRSTTDITTVAGTQDYVTSGTTPVMMTGLSATVQIASNIMVITSAAFGGTTVYGATVNFANFTNVNLTFLNGTSGMVLSSSATTLVVAYEYANTGPFVETGAATISVYGTPYFGWLEVATVAASSVTKELEMALVLGEDSKQNLPTTIATQLDDGAGNITFRLLPNPDKVYALKLTWQQAALTFSTTADTWNPIPDYMFNIYSQGYLAKAYEYLGDERAPFAMNMFLKQLVSFHGGLTESQLNIFMSQHIVSQVQGAEAGMRSQQRISSRGLQ